MAAPRDGGDGRTVFAQIDPDGGAFWVRRRPPRRLRPFVRLIDGFRQDLGAPVLRRETPIAGVPLIFAFEDRFWRPDGDRREALPAGFAAGLHDSAALVGSSGKVAGLQADLTPLGARLLFDHPLGRLANRLVDIGDLLDEGGRLTARLAEASSWSERFALLDAVLTRAFLDRDRPLAGGGVDPRLARAARVLEGARGRVRVDRLADHLDLDRRAFSRRFRAEFGASPKAMAGLARFDAATRLLRLTDQPLAAVAAAAGYADQAHLTRAVRRYAGATPSAVRAANVQDPAL